MLKRVMRNVLRGIFRVKEYETINDALGRHRVKIKKKFGIKKEVCDIDLKKALVELGINKGDNLMIHASWREFYNYKGAPGDVINILRENVGDEGTIFMPSYGPSRTYFDVDKTPTSAGVLAEVFRKQPNTFRSACTHFSVCGQGPLAEEVTRDHFYSEYGFDINSPYYKFSQLENAKILFMGLGKKPTKISLFHCAGYMLKESDSFLKNLFTYKYESVLIKNDNIYNKIMVIRKKECRNDNKNFKLIYDSIIKKKSIKLSNLDLVLIDAAEGLEKAIQHVEKGIYCYK